MLCIAWWHSRVRDFNYSIFPFAYPFQVDCTHFMLSLIFAKKGLKSCSCHFKPIFPNQSGPNHLFSRWIGPCDFTMPFCEHKQKEVTNSKLFASAELEPKRESIIWSAFQELGTYSSCLQLKGKEMKIHVILVSSAKKTLLLPLIA